MIFFDRAQALLNDGEKTSTGTLKKTPVLSGMQLKLATLGVACFIAFTPAHAQYQRNPTMEPYSTNAPLLEAASRGERVNSTQIFAASAETFDLYIQNYLASLQSNPRSRSAVGLTTAALEINIDHQIKLAAALQATLPPSQTRILRDYQTILVQIKQRLPLYNSLSSSANTEMNRDFDVLLQTRDKAGNFHSPGINGVLEAVRTVGFATVAQTFAKSLVELRMSIGNFEASLAENPRSTQNVRASAEVFLRAVEYQRMIAGMIGLKLPLPTKQIMQGYQLRLKEITEHMDTYLTDNNTRSFQGFAEGLLRFADSTSQSLRDLGEDQVPSRRY